MIRIIIKTEDVAPIVCGGGSQAEVSMKSFDVDLPEIEAFLAEPRLRCATYTTRNIIGYELIESEA